MKRLILAAALIIGTLLSFPTSALAHCDALDGPVVRAARAALDAGNVTGVLRWVGPAHEAEITSAFARTLAVRKLGGEARELADTWFFERLVRVHRAGEGAAFDGLKPAGRIDPAIAMADSALEKGAIDPMIAKMTAHITAGVKERFEAVRRARAHADDSVDAGRHYVAAYVQYVHYVEGLHLAANAKGETHER